MKYKYHLVGEDVYDRDNLNNIIKLCYVLRMKGRIQKLGKVENGNGSKSDIFPNLEYIKLGNNGRILRITE